MSGFIQSGRFGGGGGVGGHLDTQMVTTGGAGSAGLQNRQRGYSSSIPLGSISDGTSNIYAGAPVDDAYYDEGSGGGASYVLVITGAANSGWTTMTISGPNGSVALSRASATYTTGVWTWTTSDAIPTQKFGPSTSAITIDFD